MACLFTVPLPAITADWDQRRMSATIVAACAVTAFVLGARLRSVTLHGSDYRWEGESGAKAMELEAVVQTVVREVSGLANAAAFGEGNDMYRPRESPACGLAHEIFSRADVQQALDALTTALLIHQTLTADEVAEIILTAFVAD